MFPFLKYMSACNYFLAEVKQAACWLDLDRLDPEERRLIEIDAGGSPAWVKRDAAWQALNRGIIDMDGTRRLDLDSLPPLSVEDQYRFVRRYFSRTWLLYVFTMRLLQFNNPVREARGLLKAWKVPTIDLYGKHMERPDFESYRSTLLESQPMVSVIIPTLNRYDYLHDVMQDLEAQDYRNFEVIVVDQSDPVDREFYAKYDLDINLIAQDEKALWLARNTAIRQSRGDYMLLFDDDSRVSPNWISAHLKCLDYFKAEISSGVSLSTHGARIPRDYRYFRWSGQIDTGNVLLHKAVFRKVGLFDRQFEKQRMGDGEFGLRCHLNGCRNISNPVASRIHLKAGVGGLRQLGSWDAFRPKRLLDPRPIPSVLYYCRRYFGKESAILLLIRSLPPSIVPYKFKANKAMQILGSLISILLFPLIAYQVILSWRKSSRMIAEGPSIEVLD